MPTTQIWHRCQVYYFTILKPYRKLSLNVEPEIILLFIIIILFFILQKFESIYKKKNFSPSLPSQIIIMVKKNIKANFENTFSRFPIKRNKNLTLNILVYFDEFFKKFPNWFFLTLYQSFFSFLTLLSSFNVILTIERRTRER